MSPFALLVEIAQKSRDNARELPQKTEAITYWRGIGFMLAGQRFVAPMGDVGEILKTPRVTKVPGVRNWVLGVSNIRGRLVPILDLAGLLDVPSKANWRTRRVLVIGEGQQQYGLLVDAVLGMQQFPSHQVISQIYVEANCVPYVRGGFERDGSNWPIFSFTDLVQADEFLKVAV
ncbi:MAG: twitching motility protein PilI [Oleispira sp.]|jgi:twitching motility protein PilI